MGKSQVPRDVPKSKDEKYKFVSDKLRKDSLKPMKFRKKKIKNKKRKKKKKN